MYFHVLKPQKSAIGCVQKAIYTLYDPDLLSKAVFYFSEPSSDGTESYDYAFAVILLYYTMRKMGGRFMICLIGTSQVTNSLGKGFNIPIVQGLSDLNVNFPDKTVFFSVNYMRNSALGRWLFLGLLSIDSRALRLQKNGPLYIYLCMADTQLETFQGNFDFKGLMFDEGGSNATLQPSLKIKTSTNEHTDTKRILAYIKRSIEINSHALRNITVAFTTLLKPSQRLQVSRTVSLDSSHSFEEYFMSSHVQSQLSLLCVTFRGSREDVIQKPFVPSPSILSTISSFMLKERRQYSLQRIAVAFSGGKDSLCLLLHLALLSLMAHRGMLHEIGLANMRAFDVIPLTFNPQIPGFILNRIQDLCPLFLSIDDRDGGTIQFTQQLVEADVSAKLTHLKINAMDSGQEGKKTSVCSVCSRCRRTTLANFVATGDYDALALGHHLLDDLETIIMTGIHGASFFGLREDYHCEVRDIESKVKRRVRIIRPMLTIHVQDVYATIQRNGFQCVTSDAAECSLSASKLSDNEPFPGERLRARQLLESIDISRICAFRKQMPTIQIKDPDLQEKSYIKD